MENNYLTEGGFQLIQNVSFQSRHKNSHAAKKYQSLLNVLLLSPH